MQIALVFWIPCQTCGESHDPWIMWGFFFGWLFVWFFWLLFFLGGGVRGIWTPHTTISKIPLSESLAYKRDASNDNTCACLKLFAAYQLRWHHFTFEFLLHPLNNLIAHIKVYWWTDYYLVG